MQIIKLSPCFKTIWISLDIAGVYFLGPVIPQLVT